MLIKNVCIKRVNDFKLFLSPFDTLLDFLFLALAHSPTLPLSNNNCLCLEPVHPEAFDYSDSSRVYLLIERQSASRRENE